VLFVVFLVFCEKRGGEEGGGGGGGGGGEANKYTRGLGGETSRKETTWNTYA